MRSRKHLEQELRNVVADRNRLIRTKAEQNETIVRMDRVIREDRNTIADYQTLLRYGSNDFEKERNQARRERDGMSINLASVKQQRETYKHQRDDARAVLLTARGERDSALQALRHGTDPQIKKMREALTWYAQQDFGQRARSALGGAFGPGETRRYRWN